jgi:hypothetical protein
VAISTQAISISAGKACHHNPFPSKKAEVWMLWIEREGFWQASDLSALEPIIDQITRAQSETGRRISFRQR